MTRPFMAYAFQIGLRYLRSKKQRTVSVITFIAVTGVALGVAALVSVLSITSGFQDAFRDKVLGVNAHVLVLKYGLDFEEYGDVIAKAETLPDVAGAAPFLINEMMLAKDDRLSGVLVKGIDPTLMPKVLDLPRQMIDGSLSGLRRPGSTPPARPEDLARDEPEGDLDALLEELRADLGKDDGGVERVEDAGMDPSNDETLRERVVRGEADLVPDAGAGAAAPSDEESANDDGPLPTVSVPSPEDAERALEDLNNDSLGLPSDEHEQQIFAEEELELEEPAQRDEALPGIVVGRTLAANLGLGVGDRVKVISPLAGLDVSLWSAEARTPRSRDFRVIGIFEAGFQEYDSRLVYVDLYEAQRFYDAGDTVTGVEIRLHDLEKASQISPKLERMLGGGPYHTMDWAELNHNLFTALEIQKLMLSLVIATIIFVAAFNVIATLIMVVLEKKREIAILKAMGAKDSSVLGIFMVQGAIIGAVGTCIGIVLGGIVIWYLSTYRFPLDPKVYLIDHLPVRTSPFEFVVTVVVALAICLAATLIPSWWAARMLPAEGVRYE